MNQPDATTKGRPQSRWEANTQHCHGPSLGTHDTNLQGSEALQLSRVLGGNFQVHTVQYGVPQVHRCENVLTKAPGVH